MINNLKKLYNIYKRQRDWKILKYAVDPKIGISPKVEQEIKTYPPFTNGAAIFFEKEFQFSHGDSFLHSLEEIFKEEVYKFSSDTENPYIIDCGANIGLSIYYFKKFYPKAKILAFEPDDEIYKILGENISKINDNNDIEILNEAVWTEDTELSFFSEGALAGSSITDFGKKNNIKKVKAIDLKKYLNTTIDFLKIDIEGAENVVIFDIEPLLKNVKNLFLEYHGLVNEPQNLGEILNILKKQGFEYYIRLAADTIQFPFCKENALTYNQQLNIFCYRKEGKNVS